MEEEETPLYNLTIPLGCNENDECGVCNPASRWEVYMIYNLIVVGIILPLVGTLGLMGNAISAYVYSRKEMRCSTNSYLFGLACSDSAVISTGIFVFSLETYRHFSLLLDRIAGHLSGTVFALGTIAQTCSVYFTIAAGADCFAQVCLNEKIRRFVSRPQFVRFTSCFVVTFSLFYNVPHFFEGFTIDCYHQYFGGPSIEVCPTTLRYNNLYVEIYYNYMYTIFLAVGPLIMLIILNSFIIGFSVFGSASTSSEDNMSLILVVLLFICCNIAALFINIFETLLSDIMGANINFIVDFSNLLVVFNSSFNFIIYKKYSRSFADTLAKYVTGRSSEKKKRKKMRTTEDCSLKEPLANGNKAMIIENQQRSKICREAVGRLLAASQPEVSSTAPLATFDILSLTSANTSPLQSRV
ncbi:hypothetical protein WR25_22011 [Diploscapter pachys]|uniref:G-protein coupled receptors family 1 profile domain-containing protein n=1 Tax=Diploscapter pachys TaxID=2018661 RepID=A0A2A2JRJ5_9BILA|nr:hypothetical protein WR25_22011 [Diploscapter pachys]